MSTSRLGLPEIVQYQAQKEVTHNQALWMIDCLVMASVIDRATTPPTDPSDGDTYLIVATATDEWEGHEDEIAHYYWNAWHFYTPGKGWQVYVQDEEAWYVYDGTSWGAKDVTSPGGSDGDIQFNDNGAFGGTSDLNWTGTALNVNGQVQAQDGIVTTVDIGDYGGGFTNYTPPTGTEGMIVLAVDTNSGNPGTRLYAYANSDWHYVDLN